MQKKNPVPQQVAGNPGRSKLLLGLSWALPSTNTTQTHKMHQEQPFKSNFAQISNKDLKKSFIPYKKDLPHSASKNTLMSKTLQPPQFLLAGDSIIFKYLFTLIFPIPQHIKLLLSPLEV